MTLAEFNSLDSERAVTELTKCCGSSKWVQKMAAAMPFDDLDSLHRAAHDNWATCTNDDALEAFKHHPKIGGTADLAKKFASTSAWASGEQSSVNEASPSTLQALADGNLAYEAKFGFIFIVCATGKSADEMLGLLQARLPNLPTQEIEIAKAEQMKITLIRLQKLLPS